MHGRRLLYTRSDLEAFADYDRMLILHNRALDGTLAAVSMAEPVFERGLFMVIHARGLLMNSEWGDADGGPLGYLRFGEIFAVVELSPRYDGHYVVPHYEAGRVRARVERWDGVSGYISVYNTRRMQHFAVPVDGEAPWFRPRDLLRRLIADLQQPRLPLAAPLVLGVPPTQIDDDSSDEFGPVSVVGGLMPPQSTFGRLHDTFACYRVESQSRGAIHVHSMVFDPIDSVQ